MFHWTKLTSVTPIIWLSCTKFWCPLHLKYDEAWLAVTLTVKLPQFFFSTIRKSSLFQPAMTLPLAVLMWVNSLTIWINHEQKRGLCRVLFNSLRTTVQETNRLPRLFRKNVLELPRCVIVYSVIVRAFVNTSFYRVICESVPQCTVILRTRWVVWLVEGLRLFWRYVLAVVLVKSSFLFSENSFRVTGTTN